MIEIIRGEMNPKETISVLRINGEFVGFILEKPFLANQIDISCIPIGEYTAEVTTSQKYDKVLRFHGVPGRTDILMHVGNTARDTKGCQLPGLGVGWLEIAGNMERAVLDSRKAMKLIIAMLEDVDAPLHCAIVRYDSECVPPEFGKLQHNEGGHPVPLGM